LRYPGEPLLIFRAYGGPTCNNVQPLIFDVLKANDKNQQDAADIVCAECKSGRRDKKVAKTSERWRLRK
jgi:hypothetical protein